MVGRLNQLKASLDFNYYYEITLFFGNQLKLWILLEIKLPVSTVAIARYIRVRLWRYAERWSRWRSAGLSGLVSLKGGLKRVVIRKLKALSIVEYPIPKYDAETGTCRPQMLCPKLMSSAVAW